VFLKYSQVINESGRRRANVPAHGTRSSDLLMQDQRNATGGPTPTTFVLRFAAGDMAHLAADRLEHLGFRAVVHWLDHGWQVEAGALTTAATEAGALERVKRVAERYGGRVDHAHGGWYPGELELVLPLVDLHAGERGALHGLHVRLTEVLEDAAELDAPSPLTALCAEWAGELERRYDLEPLHGDEYETEGAAHA
jgi:hypothetical protein